MFQPQLLSCLQCPITLAPLAAASQTLVDAVNQAIDDGRLVQNDGEAVQRFVLAGLVSQEWLYVIDENGAHLLADEAIALQQPGLESHEQTQQDSRELNTDD